MSRYNIYFHYDGSNPTHVEYKNTLLKKLNTIGYDINKFIENDISQEDLIFMVKKIPCIHISLLNEYNKKLYGILNDSELETFLKEELQ